MQTLTPRAVKMPWPRALPAYYLFYYPYEEVLPLPPPQRGGAATAALQYALGLLLPQHTANHVPAEWVRSLRCLAA
jgi:hypothetical protein